MIFGMDSCTLQVLGFSCVRFAGESIVISGPNFRWFGFHRVTGYPQESESQQTLMDAVLDVVQVGIDLIGLIPGCNVVCGALNAGISRFGAIITALYRELLAWHVRAAVLPREQSEWWHTLTNDEKMLIKTLKVLKAGALITNAGLLGSEDLKEIARRWSEGELEWDDPDDIALFSSLLRNFQTAAGSAKDIDSETRKRTPRGTIRPQRSREIRTIQGKLPMRRRKKQKAPGKSRKMRYATKIRSML